MVAAKHRHCGVNVYAVENADKAETGDEDPEVDVLARSLSPRKRPSVHAPLMATSGRKQTECKTNLKAVVRSFAN